jgi:hypothetical protein
MLIFKLQNDSIEYIVAGYSTWVNIVIDSAYSKGELEIINGLILNNMKSGVYKLYSFSPFCAENGCIQIL